MRFVKLPLTYVEKVFSLVVVGPLFTAVQEVVDSRRAPPYLLPPLLLPPLVVPPVFVFPPVVVLVVEADELIPVLDVAAAEAAAAAAAFLST